MNGNVAIAHDLVARGAPRPSLSSAEAFLSRALAGQEVGAAPAELLSQRPGVVAWAAGLGRADAVRALVQAGFNVNGLGRSDVPVEHEWETPLHAAVSHDDVGLVKVLLELGADPSIKDRRFSNTPLGWARYGGHDQLVELLEPLTPQQSPMV
jgi:ankyrin repeat protein